NRPPTLAAIANVTVSAGKLISFTASGSDPDQPTQSITYSLDTPPAGATINAATGAFTWTPSAAQIGTTTITVRVSDNGQPALSVTSSFKVIVKASTPLAIAATLQTDGHIGLKWTTQAGTHYRVEYRTDFSGSTWKTLTELDGT